MKLAQIDAHRAHIRRARARGDTRERRFARACGADHAQKFARRNIQADIVERDAVAIGNANADALDAKIAAGRGQRRVLAVARSASSASLTNLKALRPCPIWRQAPTICSSGASARAARIEAAIRAPGEICRSIAR